MKATELSDPTNSATSLWGQLTAIPVMTANAMATQRNATKPFSKASFGIPTTVYYKGERQKLVSVDQEPIVDVTVDSTQANHGLATTYPTEETGKDSA